MKILILADPNSIHTKRWVNALDENSLEVFVCGFSNLPPQGYNTRVIVETFKTAVNSNTDGAVQKLSYLKILPEIKKIIKEFTPDILHSYYSSSYGLLGALSYFKPYLVSAWGSDVFDFPNKSFLHKRVLKFVFSRSTAVLSTSKIMANEIQKYTNVRIEVIPFGVDLSKFVPAFHKTLFNSEDLVLGSVKNLEDNYGLDLLIKYFAVVQKRYHNLALKLLIVGGGSQEKPLWELAHSLGISEHIKFTGAIDHAKVPDYLNEIDIAIFLSKKFESFGVSIVEAMACEKPVIVSYVGGLPEVIQDKISGYVVNPFNADETINSIERLIQSEELRKSMGQNGRLKVQKDYDWKDCVLKTIKLYEEIVKRN